MYAVRSSRESYGHSIAESNRRSSISRRHSPQFVPWPYSLVAGMFVIIPAFACRSLSTLELGLAAEAGVHCVRTASYDVQNVCKESTVQPGKGSAESYGHSTAEANRRSSISRRHSPRFVPWLYSLVAGMFVILSAFACGPLRYINICIETWPQCDLIN